MREPSMGFIGDATSLAVGCPGAPRPALRRPRRPAHGSGQRGILAVSLVAGAVRALPVLLSPHVPPGLALVLAQGIAAVSLETALLRRPGARLRPDSLAPRRPGRGARALRAGGPPPAHRRRQAGRRRPGSRWPPRWPPPPGPRGRGARPGRARSSRRGARGLHRRAAARGRGRPAPRRVLGVLRRRAAEGGAAAERGRGALAATALEVPDDLRAIDVADLELVLPSHAGDPPETPPVRVRAGPHPSRPRASPGARIQPGPSRAGRAPPVAGSAIRSRRRGGHRARGFDPRPGGGAGARRGGSGRGAAGLLALERAPRGPRLTLPALPAGLAARSPSRARARDEDRAGAGARRPAPDSARCRPLPRVVRLSAPARRVPRESAGTRWVAFQHLAHLLPRS